MSRLSATLLFACAALSGAPVAGQASFPADSIIQRLVDERVADGRAAGIVLGILDPHGTRFFTAGHSGTARPLDRNSLFEIGSITKVFTGTLLADMSLRGEVSLDDPVATLLPEGVRVPSHEHGPITLGSLAMQNSGLPRLPNNMRPANMLNPYADYDEDRLYEFLSGHQLRRAPGAQFEYSNLGYGLLGHALARKAGTSYEELVRERILAPLGMAETAATITPELESLLVSGHNALGEPVPHWDLSVLAGAGALRSSAEDMLKFATAALRAGPLHEALALAMQPRVPAGQPALSVGLGWVSLGVGADTIVMHNGGTGGFRTFLGITPASGRAVILLTNSGGIGSDDLALHLLNPARPLAPRAGRSAGQQ
jgi:serine-type D-Ala-D-Ala carboxypeptidase/endopeptidase